MGGLNLYIVWAPPRGWASRFLEIAISVFRYHNTANTSLSVFPEKNLAKAETYGILQWKREVLFGNRISFAFVRYRNNALLTNKRYMGGRFAKRSLMPYKPKDRHMSENARLVLFVDNNKVWEYEFSTERSMTKTEIRKAIFATNAESEAMELWRLLKTAPDEWADGRDAKDALEALRIYLRHEGFIRTRKPSEVRSIIVRDRDGTIYERFNTTGSVARFLNVSSVLSWERAAALLRKRFGGSYTIVTELKDKAK